MMLALSLMMIVAAGAEVPRDITYRGVEVDVACRHLLGQRLDKIRRRRGVEDSLLVQKLPSGYNCKGFVWVNGARVEAVFDTGSSRNSIDQSFLEALVKHKETISAVKGIEEVEPITCKSVDRNNPIVIRKLAFVDTTF